MSAVLFDKHQHIAWITINRPDAKNTLDAEAFVLLAEAWQQVREDDEIRTAVLCASGDEDFCCGGDLSGVIRLWTGQKQPETEIEHKLVADPLIADKVLLKDQAIYKPIVSAINGRALGGGCEIIQATDLRIASEQASFGLPEPKVGIVPGGGSMVRLARQIPWAHAMRMLLTAEPVSATEALAMGLVSEVVPHKQLHDRAAQVAERIAGLAPLALQAIKRTALETHSMSWTQGFEFEMRESASIMASKDAREGNKAFKEKRPSQFHCE